MRDKISRSRMPPFAAAFAGVALLVACAERDRSVSAGSPAPATVRERVRTPEGLSFQVPAGWESRPTSSAMRRAQLRIPRAPGDGEDGELVVYYFGPGEGGSVEANLERWYGQFESPDGGSVRERARTETREVGGAKVAIVEVSGTYVAAMTPGSPDRHNKPGYRMLAAVVEGTGGPWYLKAVGPDRTLALARAAFDDLVASIRVEISR